jgi:hypothetical protein
MASTSLEEQIRTLWEDFREERTGAEKLVSFLEQHAAFRENCKHKFPLLHRVCDVCLDGKPHRLLRCLECNERLTFEPISEHVFSRTGGVPYELTGERLERWVKEGSRTEEETDWSLYLTERRA